MLKLRLLSRNHLCTMVSTRMIRNLQRNAFPKIYFEEQKSYNPKSLQSFIWTNRDNTSDIKTVLKKYNLNWGELQLNDTIFQQSSWDIDRRILFCRELGVSSITYDLIKHFFNKMHLPVNQFKAYTSIGPDVNLVKNMFASLKNPEINYKDLSHLDERMLMTSYYAECLIYYLMKELNLSKGELTAVCYRRSSASRFSSFGHIQSMLKFLREDLHFSREILLTYKGIPLYHPGLAASIVKKLKSYYPDINLAFIKTYPRILKYDLNDLEKLLFYFKQYKITLPMIYATPRIFSLDSNEFHQRLQYIITNKYTMHYQQHEHFLKLIYSYDRIVPKIKYLQEQNAAYATLKTLISPERNIEKLITPRKLLFTDLKSFFKTHFGSNADKLMLDFMKHQFYACITLVQMYETLKYLKTVFSTETIYENIHAILYHKSDIKVAYNNIIKNPKYSEWPHHLLLPLSLYKIEEPYHFSGEGVMFPGKYAESFHKTTQAEETGDDK